MPEPRAPRQPAEPRQPAQPRQPAARRQPAEPVRADLDVLPAGPPGTADPASRSAGAPGAAGQRRRAVRLGPTPSQTVGPFLSVGLIWPDGPYVVPAGTPGAVWLRGRLWDGAGQPVPDGLVETWQADPAGRFDHPDDHRDAAAAPVPGFRGFGRSATTADGWFELLTVKPGRVPGPDGRLQAPHVGVTVLARGLLRQVVTRLYFADEAAANAADPVLAGVPADRRATLLAQPDAAGYRFDIRLRGDGETVFFAA